MISVRRFPFTSQLSPRLQGALARVMALLLALALSVPLLAPDACAQVAPASNSTTTLSDVHGLAGEPGDAGTVQHDAHCPCHQLLRAEPVSATPSPQDALLSAPNDPPGHIRIPSPLRKPPRA